LKVSLDNLDEVIKKELENYNVEVVRITNESIKEAAKEAAKTLKNGGPYKNRTGAYAKDWTAGQREKTKSVVQIQGYTVYNKDHFQLTHLLEYGHQSRNGGRTKAFSHIAPLNDQIGEIVASKIESKLRG
jgi:hypothetical protein